MGMDPGGPRLYNGHNMPSAGTPGPAQPYAFCGSHTTPLLQAEAMAREVHAVTYLECSAKYQENITDNFMEASSAALSTMRKGQRKRKPKRSCLLS